MTWPDLPKPIVPTDAGRDISNLPDEMQATIKRLRKYEGRPEEKIGVVGDFWS
jgi:hypothetical protein